MSVHKWTIKAPTWYVLDQFPVRAKQEFDSEWSVKKATITCCFLDDTHSPLPMAPRYTNDSVVCGEVYELLRKAYNEGVDSVFLVFDPPAYTPLDKKENVV
jgi:hypothetical protein